MIANCLRRRSISINLWVIRTEGYSLMVVFERNILRLTVVFRDCEKELLTIEVILSNKVTFLVIRDWLFDQHLYSVVNGEFVYVVIQSIYRKQFVATTVLLLGSPIPIKEDIALSHYIASFHIANQIVTHLNLFLFYWVKLVFRSLFS
jgi:hypothetical protein